MGDTMINAQIISEVVCSAHYACQNMKMTVMYPYPGFALECGVTGACQGAEIILNLPSDGSVCDPNLRQEYHLGPIECIGIGACNDMKLTIVNDGCYNIVIDSLECRENSCTGAEFEFLGNIQYKAGLFDIDISEETMSRVSPVQNMKARCVGLRACKNSDILITKDVANTIEVNVEVVCMDRGSCVGATFYGVNGVTFSKIECSDRNFCVGCTVNGRPCFTA